MDAVLGRKTIVVTLALLIAATGAYAWPRKVDMRASEPAEIAHLEIAMWRDCYDKRYPALFYHLYEMSRTQFGFSPLDSFRIAPAAAGRPVADGGGGSPRPREGTRRDKSAPLPYRQQKAPDDAGAFQLLI